MNRFVVSLFGNIGAMSG